MLGGLCMHDVMAAILKVWRHIINLSMHIYLNNNPAKLHPDPFNNGALVALKSVTPNKNNNNKMSSEMGSVPDPKILEHIL